MSPRVRLLMLILDAHCRDKTYCWFSNATLAEEFGCTVGNLKQILREMDDSEGEGLGLIHRVIVGTGRKARVGIIMRRRVDPDLPAAETDAELADAIARLTARRRGNAEAADRLPKGQKTDPFGVRKLTTRKGQKTDHELRISPREDKPSDNVANGVAFDGGEEMTPASLEPGAAVEVEAIPSAIEAPEVEPVEAPPAARAPGRGPGPRRPPGGRLSPGLGPLDARREVPVRRRGADRGHPQPDRPGAGCRRAGPARSPPPRGPGRAEKPRGQGPGRGRRRRPARADQGGGPGPRRASRPGRSARKSRRR